MTSSARRRVDRINWLLGLQAKAGFRSGRQKYLEIGVRAGDTLAAVSAAQKVGVDPLFEPNRTQVQNTVGLDVALIEATSEDFFGSQIGVFDFIFLDGLHHWEQTYRDFTAALQVLRPGGLILVDDTVPIDAFAVGRDQAKSVAWRRRFRWNMDRPGAWNGDVFKVVPVLGALYRDLDWATFTRGNGQTVFFRRRDYVGTVGTEGLPERAEIDRYLLERASKLTYWWARRNPQAFRVVDEELFQLTKAGGG